MKLILLLSILVFVEIVSSGTPRIDPLVRIDQGLVRGQKDIVDQFAYFLGIPYATVNENNPFGPAEPHPGFGEDIFSAYDGTIACPQVNHFSSQNPNSLHETIDCLRLNIYIPYEASSLNPLPVLVWIHGGKFANGYASEVDLRSLVKKGIIVVTINYRLGPYGFMCLDTPFVPGNQGLKDQFEALQWVRNNIAAFGGNPYEVTIGGQDAGSCAALLHLYASKYKLFKRVIAESGTPISEGFFVEGDFNSANKIAEYLGFNTTDTDQALDFLAKSSPDLVTGAVKDLKLELTPCVESSFSGIDNFVETFPFSLTNRKKVKDTAVLIGHTSLEAKGLLSNIDYLKTDPFYRKIKNNFYLKDDHLMEAANTVKHYYIGDKTMSEELLSDLETFESDFVYNYPIQRVISNLIEENANPIYEYLFKYDTDGTGAKHSAEIPYLFSQALLNNEYNEDTSVLIDRISTLWANFVKYGNPTPSTTDIVPLTWEPVTAEARPYLVIDKELSLESRIYQDRMSFWNLFYSLYGNKHILTRECKIYRQREMNETNVINVDE